VAENTKIEWCDHTWNPWIGCTQVSPACDHCYAMELMDYRYRRVTWGAGEDRVRTSAGNWNEPLRWEQKAAAANAIETVFCLSLGDIWDNEVDSFWRRQAFAVMRRTPHLLYLLLSKRIGNAVKMCDPFAGHDGLPENAALGATMVNQPEWDRDLPKLKEAAERLGARFAFVSVEPMLGPINTRGELPAWVICGGESGLRARPMHSDWARSLRDQCVGASVPFHFKQWGEWLPVLLEDGGDVWLPDDGSEGDEACRFEGMRRPIMRVAGQDFARVGKRLAGRLLDGRTWDEAPA